MRFLVMMMATKPHFLKNGKYAAVISTSKEAVSFTIFKAAGLALPEGLFDGPPERKTIKLKQGQAVDASDRFWPRRPRDCRACIRSK